MVLPFAPDLNFEVRKNRPDPLGSGQTSGILRTKGRLFRAVLCHAGKMNRTGKEAGRKRNGKDPKGRSNCFRLSSREQEKKRSLRAEVGAAAARAKQKGPEDLRKQKRPGGPQRTKKGPQTLTGRIWDIRHISCLKKRCDLSVSAGTLSIAQFVRSYNPILEIYPNFF